MVRVLLIGVLALLSAVPGMAQERFFVQITAQPTLDEALRDLRGLDRDLPGLGGFRLLNGQYAVALGPFATDVANQERARLIADGKIPATSFLVVPETFRRQFWPAGATALSRNAPLVEPQNAALTLPTPESEPVLEPEETPSQARASERTLDRAAREDLQRALAWFGHYQSAIDGAIGPGSRRAMSSWQTAKLYPDTGVLTTRQRAELMGDYRAELDALGLASITDDNAGITIEIPTGQVSFEKIRSPFVHYTGEGDSAARVILISQPGGSDRLRALYQVMQTLEIIPEGASGRLRNASFTLSGEDDRTTAFVQAQLTDDGIKGFGLIWPKGLPGSAGRVADAMRSSFSPIAGQVLDAEAGGLQDQDVDLLAGLEIRRPKWVRSGVFIDARGRVLTLAEGLEACSRVTIGDEIAATSSALSNALVLLTPETGAAPLDIARFDASTPRIGSDIAVAGYAYGGRLPAPTLTPGTLEDVQGLNGESGLSRLGLTRAHGGEGGPVLSTSGAVIGLLQSAAQGLPAATRTSLDATALTDALTQANIPPEPASAQPVLSAPDLSVLASDITAKVACWNG